MNHYKQATHKGKEEFNNYFLGGIREGDHESVESFLDSYSEEIRLAVIEDVRECALIKVRKIDFGSENSDDIKHNEVIMDFLAKLPSER